MTSHTHTHTHTHSRSIQLLVAVTVLTLTSLCLTDTDAFSTVNHHHHHRRHVVSSSTPFGVSSSSLPDTNSNSNSKSVLYAGTLIDSGNTKDDKEEEEEEEEEETTDSIDIEALIDEAASSSTSSDDLNGAVEDDDEGAVDVDDAVNEHVNDNQEEGDESKISSDMIIDKEEELDEQSLMDIQMMQKAIMIAKSTGEQGTQSPFPKPIEGAILATPTGQILGSGHTSYSQSAIEAALSSAGIIATPLSEWCVNWPSSDQLRKDIREATLYVTLEPSSRRRGASLPPMTQLIQMSGITRVVIGSPDPVLEWNSEGAGVLHGAGLEVVMGVESDDANQLLRGYKDLANSKLQKMARKHFDTFGRPLGFLHCSVVDSDDVDSFARNGNTFGKDFGGKMLGLREFGSYALAPPPDSIWADNVVSDGDDGDGDDDMSDFFGIEEDDDDNNDEDMDLNEYGQPKSNPMMPWYEQMDAVVGTFPRAGNGPKGDQSIKARLNGLKWLATNGNVLPANVERILVMDATDLQDLPISNDDPNLPLGVDVEAFWESKGRKASRILLRSGDNAQAISAAKAASVAAGMAAEAAETARFAIESGDAELAAEAALECQQAALAATQVLQKEMQISQDLRQRLVKLGAKVEVIKGREPIDVMNHLGKRNGYNAVVWRAGCWGQRGVDAIMAGAFQWVSAHLAVDAVGGKFWQLMLAERAIQAACGSENKVKVLAEQEDFSLEYCDDESGDCEIKVNGRPIRHIRLDCRVLVIDEDRPINYVLTKTAPQKDKLTTEAPWFI